MTLTIRPLNIRDYDDVLVGWWKDWGFTPPSRDFLPADGVGGLMVEDDGQPVCAGFVYFTNARVAWVDWIISSKTYRKKPDRGQAIDYLINTLTDICANSGFVYGYALIKNSKLVSTYERLGYIRGGSYTEEMIKVLNNGT